MLSWIRRHLELTPDATDSDFWIARVVARDLGIDTFEVTLWRTELNPLGSTGTTPGGVPTPVGHAYSPNWPELGCRSLLDHPGIGGDLLTIGLRSP